MNELNLDRSHQLVIAMPCFNEAGCLLPMFTELCQRLMPLIGIIGEKWGLLLVDDGSTDSTWSVINRLCEMNPGVRGIRLSKNMGQQAAVLCAYCSADADWVVTMDADLQDRPEAIAEMIKLNQQGYQIVVGRRKARDTDSLMKRFTAWGFYRLMQMLGIDKSALQSSEFRLLTREAIDAMISATREPIFHRFTVFELGYHVATVDFDRSSRIAGETKYSLLMMLRLANQAVWGSRTAIVRIMAICLGLECLMTLGVLLASFLEMRMPTPPVAISLQILVASGFLMPLNVVCYRSIRTVPLFQVAERSGSWGQVSEISISSRVTE